MCSVSKVSTSQIRRQHCQLRHMRRQNRLVSLRLLHSCHISTSVDWISMMNALSPAGWTPATPPQHHQRLRFQAGVRSYLLLPAETSNGPTFPSSSISPNCRNQHSRQSRRKEESCSSGAHSQVLTPRSNLDSFRQRLRQSRMSSCLRLRALSMPITKGRWTWRQ